MKYAIEWLTPPSEYLGSRSSVANAQLRSG